MERRLNLGCGQRHRQGWINLDNNPKNKPDVLRDLKRGLPYDDNSVDSIYISHVLEHFEWDDFFFIMAEMHRVLKPGARVDIIVPCYTFLEGAFDIDHKIIISRRTFKVLEYNFQGCQDYTVFNYGRLWKVVSFDEDKEGKRGEPQLYITMEK